MCPTFVRFLLFFLLPIERAVAFQYVGNDSMPTNVSVACTGALTKDIACDPYVRRFRPGQYYTQTGLTRACTKSCNSALNSYQISVVAACSGQNYTDDSGYNAQEITIIPDLLRYHYNKSCLQSDAKFCNILAGQAAQGQNGQQLLGALTSSAPAIDPCDDCFIKNLQFEANSPYYDGPAIGSIYSSKTQSCHKTGFPLSTSSVSSSAPGPTATKPPCTGKTYQINSGDDCNSIAKSQGIGTAWLLMDNGLNAYCDDFPITGSLCLENTCTTYTVKTNDTCTKIAVAAKITTPQLLAWNPIISLKCGNLGKLVGDEVCIGSPGRSYVAPTASFSAVTSAATAAPVPTDVADETNHKCGRYYKAVVGDYCNLLMIKFGISLEDFVFLNPAINSNCTNLFAEESYCVLPVGNINDYPGHPGYTPATTVTSSAVFANLPDATYTPPVQSATSGSPRADRTRRDCDYYIEGSKFQIDIINTLYGSQCEAVADGLSVALTDFGNWNPSLDVTKDACKLSTDFSYCASWYQGQSQPTSSPYTVLPFRDGASPECTQFAPAVQGDTCAILLDGYDLTIAQFYAWNPAVGTNCENLWLNFQYCVRTPDYVDRSSSAGVTASPTTAPAGASNTAGSPTAGATAPGPTQSGQPANCVRWYIAKAKAGDTCTVIENDSAVSPSNFLKWNPAISSDCTAGLWADYAYCTGTSDETLTRTSRGTEPTPTQGSSPAAGPK